MFYETVSYYASIIVKVSHLLIQWHYVVMGLVHGLVRWARGPGAPAFEPAPLTHELRRCQLVSSVLAWPYPCRQAT